MKKNILSLSIAQLIGGLGQAPSAHVLQIPYCVPPSREGRAVTVRFRGNSSSEDVFDFAAFLAPDDVWTPKNIEIGSANG